MPIIEPKTLKGFRDFGPKEQAARQKMFAQIQSVFERFGFLPLATPALEYKEILMGKYGEDEKLVYSFTDNGGREVALRYDLTVPLARYVAENQNQLTYPFKRYQIAPVWRADNPQKGRFREFYQCDVDTVGSAAPLADAEVIVCLCKTLEAVGVVNYRVLLNDRRNFNEIFGENATEVIRSIDKLDKLSWNGVENDLQAKGFGQDVIQKVNDYFVFATKKELPYRKQSEALKNLIVSGGVPIDSVQIDPSIARGLDYYSSTIFEIQLIDRFKMSIVGGGRYDNLLDKFSKTSLPAVGGSIGIDRLFEAAQSLSLIRANSSTRVLLLNLGEQYESEYLSIATKLRSAGLNTEVFYQPAKLDKQFKYAESKGATLAVIWGEKEKQAGKAQVKNLATREQKTVSANNLVEFIKNRLADEKK